MKHICIVSDQLMPNFLPCLDTLLRPDEVTLIVSDTEKIKQKAKYLNQVIRQKGISISEDIVVSKTYDVKEMQDKILEWIDGHNQDFNEYCLNATGGTKIMSFAAYEAFRQFNIPVFYIEISTDEIVWLTVDRPKGEETSVRKLIGEKPTLNQYFTLNGIAVESIEETRTSPMWNGLIKTFVDKQQEWQKELGKLNLIASDFEKNNTLRGSVNDNLSSEFLEALYANELIKYNDIHRFEFRNQEARYFCNGGWLEDYVHSTLMNLIRDGKRVQKNVQINAIENGTNLPNELDVVALYKNFCYVFECKTKNMAEGNTVNDIIYKLQAIIGRRLSLRTNGFIVSYRSVSNSNKKRAEGYGIEVIDDLSRLEEILKGKLKIEG